MSRVDRLSLSHMLSRYGRDHCLPCRRHSDPDAPPDHRVSMYGYGRAKGDSGAKDEGLQDTCNFLKLTGSGPTHNLGCDVLREKADLEWLFHWLVLEVSQHSFLSNWRIQRHILTL